MNDLNAYALRLLKFVEDSTNEALVDAASRQALLSEADDAIRVLQRTLIREDKTKHAQLMLVGTFDQALADVANENPQGLSNKVKEALEIKMRAKIVFCT